MSQAAQSAGDGDDRDIFASIYGHSSAKYRLRAALRDGDTHVLLVGPPGSGKSEFLHALERNLPGVRYVDGESVKKSRMKDLLSEDPPILLVDEADEMDYDAYRTVAVPMEHGRVVKESSREQYDVEIDTQFIMSCNSTDRIPDHIISRTREIQFEAYTEEEFVGVCKHFLPREVDWVEGEGHAEKVARVALEAEGETDPRIARDIAKMASGPDEVETVAKAARGETVDGDVSLRPEDVARTRGDVMDDRLVDTLTCEVFSPGECTDGADTPTHDGPAETAEPPAPAVDDETAEAVGDDIEAAVEDAIAE